MQPRRLLVTSPNSDKGASHRRKRIFRSDVRNETSSPPEDDDFNKKKKKHQKITPSPFPPPDNSRDCLNGVERLVASITQSPLGSTRVVESPRRSPRLLKVARVNKCNNLAPTVKSKQKVAGFKLDDTTVYAWFRGDSEHFPSASASSLKRKAQNNFQTTIQPKQRQVQAVSGKSLRIAEQLKINNKPKSRATKSIGTLPHVSSPPSSIPSTQTIESNSLRRYLIEDFLFSDIGDPLLLQVAVNHPNYAQYSTLYKQSEPKPLRRISGNTFIQIPCVSLLFIHSEPSSLVECPIVSKLDILRRSVEQFDLVAYILI